MAARKPSSSEKSPKRRAIRAREAQLAFEALSIEGGLLSPEWLSKVAQLSAEAQSGTDYRIHKALNLRDEIGRYWRIAQAHWTDFAAGRSGNGDGRALAERFVTALLSESFGFGTLGKAAPVVIAERTYPIGSAALGGRVPVVIAPPGTGTVSGLETPDAAFGDGTRRRSAFGLAQEYLNAADEAMWGLASDGLTLRVLRDNASLTRPAWIEADLQRIFTEERYPDFAALWLLVHETRFGRADQPVSDCALEQWRSAGREQGTRAREHLRRGVEDALVALGQGFLAHPDNQSLRAVLESGALPVRNYFGQILRLVYRLIFLLTAEERSVLRADGKDPSDEKARALYAAGYGMKRLRERSVKRSAHDRFADLWEATKIVFRGLSTGEPRLGLPALGGLFAPNQCTALDGAKLQNAPFLLAVFKLSWLREDSGLSRVNWRDMGPEELGSVYESLLELVPQLGDGVRKFAFAEGAETKGNARKTTGSYYTPESLVQVLLDSALEPVIQDTIAGNPENPVEALLRLSIVDPACGSGHFLLAAARRLASHVARLRANGTPSGPEHRHAVREVVGRCLYGVDLNPMAVELCKVSLWMEAVEPGLPLTFLNSHIQQGNALLGTTPELMAKGIPDAAWEPIEGDDKKTASVLKKRNKTAAKVEYALPLFAPGAKDEMDAVARAVADLDGESDASSEGLAKKESRWDGILGSAEYRHQKLVADAWCAAFVWPKQPGALAEAAATDEKWRELRDGQGRPLALTLETTSELATQYSFFHWHLQFPQVFAKGGFDVVLGNPPWENVELKEEEWFAERRPDIAAAPNASARKKRIAQLATEDPQLFAAFGAALRGFDGETQLMRSSGRYPLCAKGRINTYAIFAEHNRSVLGPQGRAGFIVPSGIATDDTTKEFFASLVSAGHLVAVYDFLNTGVANLFRGVGHDSFRFALVSLGHDAHSTDLVFDAREAADLSDRSRHCFLAPGEFTLLNPNTRTCPTLRSRRDANINLAIYRRAGILWRETDAEDGNAWRLRFMQGVFNMASDSGLFKTRAELEAAGQRLDGNRFVGRSCEFLPLIEAKMVHHFDHRYGDYSDRPAEKDGSDTRNLPDVPISRLIDPAYQPVPRYWVAAEEVSQRLTGRWSRSWLLGWRDICRSGLGRTLTASLIPRVAVGHTTPLMFPDVDPTLVACLYSSLCSFAVDYTARQKIGGTHLTYSYLKQLPVLPPATYGADTPWHRGISLRDWILPRVLELTYTAWDLEPFARDVGYDDPPFRWDPARRFLLRAELDAAFFRLHGVSRDDTDYVMDTFPIVRKNDEKAHGEYRTKCVILEIYDAMADAERTEKAYVTRLEPPPADARVAHPASTRPQDSKMAAKHGVAGA